MLPGLLFISGVIVCIALTMLAAFRGLGPREDVDPRPQPCDRSITAVAWIDENGNRSWESEEPPLSGAKFYFSNLAEAVSDADGVGRVTITLETCSSLGEYNVYARSPDGYRLTTPSRITAHEHDEGPFLFGFTYLPGQPTVTPRPVTPVPPTPTFPSSDITAECRGMARRS